MTPGGARRPRRRAFTLLEVLAALVLVGIVLPVAMRGLSLAMVTASQARRKAEAAGLAERQLTELIMTGAWQDGTLEGDFGDDYPDYKWTLDVREWLELNLQEVELRVEWTDHEKDRYVALTTLVFAETE